jgi:DNA invertase Pin-like site-specific DNA recombinase
MYISILRASARKATDPNQEFEYQKTECRRIAARNGVKIGKWVKGVETTKRPLHKRKLLLEIIDGCNTGLWDGIVVSSADRLIRNHAEEEYIRQEAYDNGWSFLAGDTIYDWGNPDHRLICRIIGAVSQHTREVGSYKQTKWASQRQEEGKPMGPQADATPEAMAIIINLWDQGMRGKLIADYLNAHGVPVPIPYGPNTKRAVKWYPTHIIRNMERYARTTA